MPPTAPTGQATPEELLLRFRGAGDPAALGALFDATAPALFRAALALARDAASAEDALQETYLAALEEADRYDAARPVMPWLLGILRRQVGKGRRREGRTVDPLRVEPRLSPADPADEAGRREIEGRVREALEALPEPYRGVALLRWRYGLEPAEIAHVRGEPPGTTRSLLHRAMEKVRGALGALPAFLFGPRVPRGLDAVRDEVLRRAPARAAAGAGVAAAAVAAGGILMAKKAVAVAAAIAALAGGWALLGGLPGPPTAPPAAPPASSPSLAASPPSAGSAPAAVPAEAPAPPPDGRPMLRGGVRDAGGRPVAGARVASVPGPGSAVVEAAALPGVATAGDGRFSLPAPGEAPWFDLVVSAPGFAPARVREVRPGVEVDVRLEREVVLAGSVLDRGGAPVPGARVRVHGMAGLAHFVREAVSGAAGEYRVEGLAARMAPELGLFLHEVEAAGFAPLVRAGHGEIRAGPDGVSRLDFVLGRGGAVLGTVAEVPGGDPVAGARVALWSHEALSSVEGPDGAPILVPYGLRILARGESGADGTFRLEGIPSIGSYAADDRLRLALGAWAGGRAPEVLLLPRPEEGGEVRATIRLHPAAPVAGRVVGRDGAPVADAFVSAGPVEPASPVPSGARFPSSLGPVPGSTARTDAEGRYRLGAVAVGGRPAGRVLVKAWRFEGLAGWGNRAEAEVEAEARCGSESRAPDLVLTDDPRGSCTVLVSQGGGGPVRGAAVGLVGIPGPGALTDREGRAAVRWWKDARNLPPDARLLVRARGFAPALLPLPGEGEEGWAVLRSGSRLAGRVLEADGAPAAGAEVLAVDTAASPALLLSGEASPFFLAPGRPVLIVFGRAVAAADGSFSLEDLPAGPVHLLASRRVRFPARPGPGDAVRAVAESVEPGRPDLLLRFPPDGGLVPGAVEVQVLDAANGRPLPAASAWLGREGRWEAAVDAGSRVGRFRFEVPEGTWTLRASAHGYAAATVAGIAVRAGETTTPDPVALRRGAAVAGRLLAPAGTALEGRSVRVLPAGPGTEGAAAVEAAVDRDGAFRAEGLLPGTWRIEVGGAPVLAAADGGRFEVREGETRAACEWAVVPAAPLYVNFEGDRVPAAGLRIQVLDGTGALLLDEPWDPGPRARPLGPRHLPPGPVLLRVLLPGGGVREERLVLEAGETASPVLRFP